MKNLLSAAAMILIASLLVSHVINIQSGQAGNGGFRETEGTLGFTVRTVTYNGPYAPRNSGAIWITNAQNQFIKTIKVWAIPYRYTLVRWNASSGGNTTGAITGASLNNHILHSVTWNGANYQGAQVPDGEYKVNVEFTEHNATASNLGKYKQVSFVKGPTPLNETIPNETWFRDMTLVWNPVVPNGTVVGSVSGAGGVPIVGATVQTGTYSASTSETGYYELSLPPGSWDLNCSATGYDPASAPGVIVASGGFYQQDFVLDAVVPNSDNLATPSGLELLQIRPNPFRSRATLSFRGSGAQAVELDIYNIRGQKVWSRIYPSLRQEITEVAWDGRDEKGKRCPSGSYIAVLRQGTEFSARKLQLLE